MSRKMTALVVLTIVAALGSAALATPLTIGAILAENDTAVSPAFEAALEAANSGSSRRFQPRIVHVRSSAEAEKAACDLLAAGAVALVTDAAPSVTRTVARVAAKAQVPHISVAAALPELDVFSAQMWPQPEAVYRAAQKQMGDRSSGPVAFIHRPSNVAVLQQVKTVFGERSRLFAATTSPAFSLINAKVNGFRTFVVEMPASDVKAFLNAVRTSHMDGAEYSYFIVAPDAAGLQTSPSDSRMAAQVQLLSIAPVVKAGETRSAPLELQRILRTDKIPVNAALIFDAVQLLTSSLNQVMEATQIASKALSCSGSQTFAHGSSIINTIRLGLPNENGATGPITYSGSKRTDLKLGVMDISKRDGTLRRRPLRQANTIGKKLRVVTLSGNLFVKKEKKNGVDTYDGFAIALLKELAKEMDFTYTLYEASDGNYGSLNSSGQWNGMIGELSRKKADIAVGPITVTYERERVVDFTMPFMQVTTNMLFKKPSGRYTAKPFAFFNVLSVGVWLTLLVAYVIISFALFFVAKLSPYEWHKPHDGADHRVNKFQLHTAFWFAIAGCLRQYPGLAPRSTAARVIAGFWWLVVLLVFLYYAVNLAPFLERERRENPVSTFADLAQQTNIKASTLGSGSTEGFFKRSAQDTYMTIYQRMKANEGSPVKSYEDGIKRVLDGFLDVFIGEKQLLTQAAQKYCELQVSSEGIDSKGYAFGLQQDSPYRKQLNSALLKIMKVQKLSELERRYLRDNSRCGDPSKKSNSARVSQLSMDNMYAIFLLLVVGVIIGLLCLVLETFAKRCCGKSEEAIPMSELRQSLTMSTKRTTVETEAAAEAAAEA